jgi:chromosome segregation ATPase
MENNEDPIKKAFEKVREDMNFLNNELFDIKSDIAEIREAITLLSKASTNTQTDRQTHDSVDKQDHSNSTHNPTIRHINTTNYAYTTDNSTHSSTVPQEIEGLKYPNLHTSTGNQGVSTDRQTDTQTDRQTHNTQENQQKSIESNLYDASVILGSLDSIKKEIRLKFKQLTSQEMSVFSTIYQLEEQFPDDQITYKLLSKQLKLSESSIRDYVQRMMNKGIPIKKQKINNKQITLKISSELKQMATLPTIMKLREL